MKKLLVYCIFSALIISSANAQDDFLIKGSLDDAKILLEGYIGPGMRALGSGLNQGWYNTAKPHEKFGFDLTITTSLIYVPSNEELYTVDNTKLSRIKLVEYDGKQIPLTGSGDVPTLFGPDKAPKYSIVDDQGVLDTETIEGPPGLDLENQIKLANALPVPMYNFGFGLPKSFDLRVRFAPTLTLQDLKFKLWGVGLMHNVGQYLPGVKALPIDISLFAGYTKMDVEVDVSGNANGSNQTAETSISSGTVQALISKKLSVFTFYGGVGYNFSNSSLKLKGTYDLDDDGIEETTDPINSEFDTSGFRATGGLRIKLAIITLHADYTLGDYDALTAGFGINIR